MYIYLVSLEEIEPINTVKTVELKTIENQSFSTYFGVYICSYSTFKLNLTEKGKLFF